MRIRRGLLFWGLLLIPLGAVPLLTRAGVIDTASLLGVWRLWPLILIAAGIALVAGRTRASVVGVVVLAVSLGTLGGVALANGNQWFGALADCGATSSQTQHVVQNGAFETPASVELHLDCGTIDVSTTPESGWSLSANVRGVGPRVDASGTTLSIRSPDGAGSRRQEWTIKLPASLVRELTLEINAATATFDLAGARLDTIQGDFNAGDVRIDAGRATVGRIGLEMNAGRVRLNLGSAATTGTLSVNAGAIDLCVPDNVELRFRVDEQLTFATNLDERGMTKSGTTWTRSAPANAPAAAPVIDLEIKGNAAAFNLNPSEGCS